MIRVPSNGVWRRWSTLGCVSLLFFLLPSNSRAQNKTAAPQNQQQSSAALRAAQSALEGGDAEQAIRILSDYLRSHPEDPGAQLALGEIYERTGQLEKAEPLLAGAAKASHGDPEIRLQWAVVLARLHKYKEAESALAGLAPPADREARIGFYRLKASVALGLGKATAAASEMEKALALKAGRRSAYVGHSGGATAIRQLATHRGSYKTNLRSNSRSAGRTDASRSATGGARGFSVDARFASRKRQKHSK